MDLDEIKRGLRAEIKKRENEQYFTFQCNVRQMCKDVLAKLEEQEAAIAELKQKLHDAEMQADLAECAVTEYNIDYDKLNDKNRRLKRALWLARAERAADRARIFYFNDLTTMLDIDGFSYDSKKKKGHKKLTAREWRIIWLKVERKCREKAEEYK